MKKVIIYGAGLVGRVLYETIVEENEKVELFIDEFTDKKEIFGIPIKKITEIEKKHKNLKVYVTVFIEEVAKKLHENEFTQVYDIYDAKRVYKNFYKHYKEVKKDNLPNAKDMQQYLGSNHTCTLCNSNIKEFLSGGYKLEIFERLQISGGGYRKNAQCPICSASDRERLMYYYLTHKTKLFESNAKLLHFAPEATLEKIIRKHKTIEYTTADLSRLDVEKNMDIVNIEEQDNFYDVVICSHVLEHIVDDIKAMSEIYRVLKNGGWSILMVPQKEGETYEDYSITSPEERLKHFGQEDHVRIYGDDYIDRLKSVGFKVKEIPARDICSEEEIEKFGFTSRIGNIFLCSKDIK